MTEKQKKIVIIGSAHPLRGGLAAYNERLAKAFQQAGYDTVIYTFSLQYPSFLFPGKTQYSSDPPSADLTINVSINSINPFNWLRYGKRIKRLNPDLVIIKYWTPFMAPCLGTMARIIRKNKVSRIISIIDNIIPHEKHPGDRLLSNYWVKSVDGFIAMSKSVLADLNTFDHKKPKMYSPHPLYDNFGESVTKSEAKHRLNLNPDTAYMLFFGFIRDYKGLDLLIKAFADERILKLNIKLIVAGEFYTDATPYFKLISDLKLNDRIIMDNNFIPDTNVVNYFCASDLVVQPYKHATQSGVTQIAYHFNKPMITTNVGGLSEMVPDGVVGYVTEPDVQQVADAIYKFYNEKKESEFSTNMNTEKQKFSWNNMLQSLNELNNKITIFKNDNPK